MERGQEPGFAPSDLTDGRKLGEWESRYRDPEAKSAIRNEAIYLGVVLACALTGLFLVVFVMPEQFPRVSSDALHQFRLYVGAWIAGTLGGTLYTIKWLYHSVAHNSWNIDRTLWRLFTPHVAGALGLSTILTVASGLFGFFDPSAVDRLPGVLALGFLSGYFSDSVAAKLADIATSVFGKTRQHGE